MVAMNFVIGVVLVLFFLGLGIGVISFIVAELRYRRRQRDLANRWKQNADPFTGAP